MLFDSLLARRMRIGTLQLLSAKGKAYQTFGSGRPVVALRLNHIHPISILLALRPDLKIAQAYQDGRLSIARGSLRDLLYILSGNYQATQKDPLFKLLSVMSSLSHHKYNSDFMKCVYGFMPEPKFRFTHLKQRWPRTSKFFFAKPWQKLFHIQRSWAGIKKHIPGKSRGIIRPVVLSLTQYLSNKKKALGVVLDNAQRFAIQTKSESIPIYVTTIKMQRRYYAGALKKSVNEAAPQKVVLSYPFDQRFFGTTQLYFKTGQRPAQQRGLKSAHIHVNTKAAVVPLSKEVIIKWERSTSEHSDHFVRHETS